MAKHSEEFCKIEFIKEIPCLYWKMHGATGGEDFKVAVMSGIEAFREYKLENANISLIIDLSAFAPVGKVDINWVNDEVMPLLYMNNGVRIIAMVLPTDAYAKEVATEFHLKTEQLHVVGICDSVEHAKEWIRNGADSQKIIGDYTMFASAS